mmetsp:Transcript_14736/g.21046  ORF Transcript_14736/g.21046 Transcript_14736/m.21046 type:complete len:209 (-) Transcript_14736:423-1049(-)
MCFLLRHFRHQRIDLQMVLPRPIQLRSDVFALNTLFCLAYIRILKRTYCRVSLLPRHFSPDTKASIFFCDMRYGLLGFFPDVFGLFCREGGWRYEYGFAGGSACVVGECGVVGKASPSTESFSGRCGEECCRVSCSIWIRSFVFYVGPKFVIVLEGWVVSGIFRTTAATMIAVVVIFIAMYVTRLLIICIHVRKNIVIILVHDMIFYI